MILSDMFAELSRTQIRDTLRPYGIGPKIPEESGYEAGCAVSYFR